MRHSSRQHFDAKYHFTHQWKAGRFLSRPKPPLTHSSGMFSLIQRITEDSEQEWSYYIQFLSSLLVLEGRRGATIENHPFRMGWIQPPLLSWPDVRFLLTSPRHDAKLGSTITLEHLRSIRDCLHLWYHCAISLTITISVYRRRIFANLLC